MLRLTRKNAFYLFISVLVVSDFFEIIVKKPPLVMFGLVIYAFNVGLGIEAGRENTNSNTEQLLERAISRASIYVLGPVNTTCGILPYGTYPRAI